ncbi:MAG: precorrin-2 dehydrogenase/sirohydrochlorin ferrochelatase family protein [Arcobacteraceae bacterium]|jgi:precorrin-2 dehydrogenase/sirohydrochlorin ferrochelatase
MKYFPLYLKMDKIKVLIVGGGYIATEKLEKILDFTTDITIISPFICSEAQEYIAHNNLSFCVRKYEKDDIKEFDLIVIAVDDLLLQKDIFDECKLYNKLCNSVDSVDYCNFIFPAYIKKGGLTVSISTSGKSPAIAKHIKSYLAKKIPDEIGDFLEHMDKLRNSLPKGKERMEHLSKLASDYFEQLEEIEHLNNLATNYFKEIEEQKKANK